MNKKQILILSLASLFVFALISTFVLLGKTPFDYSLSNSISAIQSESLNMFFIFLGNYSEAIMIAIALFFATALYLKKRKAQSLILILTLAAGYILKLLVKIILQRERPASQLIQETGFSFPSGHALESIILFSMLIYFYQDEIKSKVEKILFACINVLLILLVGFSRIYLNVHWLTDVIAGYALGFFIVNLGILFLKKRN